MSEQSDGEIDRTQVGHCKVDPTNEYAGRGRGGRSMINTEIGTRGWLGNPHALDDGYSRAESIDLFRDDFEARIRGDDEFREAVRDLSGSTLGCWCQHLDEDSPACHAEVIAEWADRLAAETDGDLVTDGGRDRHTDELDQRLDGFEEISQHDTDKQNERARLHPAQVDEVSHPKKEDQYETQGSSKDSCPPSGAAGVFEPAFHFFLFHELTKQLLLLQDNAE